MIKVCRFIPKCHFDENPRQNPKGAGYMDVISIERFGLC